MLKLSRTWSILSPAPLVALLVAGAVALGASPASAADKETRQMMADIRMLQEQSQQLQNLVTTLTETLKAVDTRLGGRIDEQTAASRKSLADQKLVVDTVSNDLRVVREKVDDNNVRVGSLSQEIEALRQLVTQMSAPRPAFGAPAGATTPDDAPPASSAAAAAGTPADAAGTPPPATMPSAVGASPKKTFDQALSDYWSNDYDLAIDGFQAYIKNFPRSEQAADAQVNIGNCYSSAGQYAKAVDAYDTAIRTYPGAPVLADAYYKKGVSLQSLNQLDAARASFEAAITNYPNTDAARLASQRLPEIKKP